MRKAEVACAVEQAGRLRSTCSGTRRGCSICVIAPANERCCRAGQFAIAPKAKDAISTRTGGMIRACRAFHCMCPAIARPCMTRIKRVSTSKHFGVRDTVLNKRSTDWLYPQSPPRHTIHLSRPVEFILNSSRFSCHLPRYQRTLKASDGVCNRGPKRLCRWTERSSTDGGLSFAGLGKDQLRHE